MKQIIIDLIAYCEDQYSSDVVLSAFGRWGEEDVHSAAHAVIRCLSWDRSGHKKDRFGKMRLPPVSDFTKMVRQWVTETPELAALFEVREDDIYLRDDLPSQEVDDMAAWAHESMLRNVHVRPM
ncbi:MAG: hypothetical protein JWQ02_747 [Capsulimonas sp.]|jgi:hypothetical protein|nr:hypothetical protein [Capsulimonas sp.]